MEEYSGPDFNHFCMDLIPTYLLFLKEQKKSKSVKWKVLSGFLQQGLISIYLWNQELSKILVTKQSGMLIALFYGIFHMKFSFFIL